MSKMKDLLIDLQSYDELNEDEQKTIREMYNITKKDVRTIQDISKMMSEITIQIGGE